jgi:hypothetical protein
LSLSTLGTGFAEYVSCSNFPTKCIERYHMTVLLSYKHHGYFTYDLQGWPCELLLSFLALCLSTILQNARRHRQTFIRPWSVCTIKQFCFRSWHYLRRFPVAFGGFLQQFFMNETKFDQETLLRHISCKNIAGSLKHNLTKTHWTQ